MDTSLFRRAPLHATAWLRLAPYGLALASSGGALAVSLLGRPWLERTPMVVLYVAVFLSTRFGSMGAGLLAAGLTTVLAGVVVLPPTPGFSTSVAVVVPLAFYFGVSLLTVSVVGNLRRRTLTLREKERQLSDFVENATIGIHWVGEDGRVLWANKALLEMLGFAAEEYAGRNVRELHADPPVARDILARLGANETLRNYEARLTARDGSIKTVLIDSNGCSRPGQIVQTRCFIRDITPRKQAEEGLQQSEKRFRQLAENIQQVFWLWDAPSNRIIYVSPAFDQVWGFGRPAADDRSESWLKIVHPEDAPALLESMKPLRSGTSSVLEFRIIRPNGEVRWICNRSYPVKNETGEVCRIAGVAEDVTERRQIERALAENETKFRAVFENSMDAIQVSKGNRIVLVNPAFLHLFGCARGDEVAGGSVLDFVAPPQRGLVEDRIQRRNRGETVPSHYETRGLRRDGSEFDVEVDVSTFELHGEAHSLVIVRDITAQKRAEASLRASESSLRLAQRIGRIGGWEVDLTRGSLQWSDETYRIFGCRPESFTPNEGSFFELIHPADRARVRQASEDAMPGRKRYTVEYRIVRADGIERFVTQQARLLRDERGRVRQLIGTVQDITERKQAEEALAEQRNLLRTLIDNLPDYVYTKDKDSRYVICNLAHVRGRGGSSEQDFRGKTVFDLFPPDLAQRYFDDDQRVIASGLALYDRVEPIVLPDGGQRVLLTTKLPLRDADGQITGLVGITRDITERKQAEEAIQTLNEELEDRVARRTQELQEVNRELEAFSCTISHDLRAPLRAIDGFSQIIQEEYATRLDPEGLRLFNIISQNAKKMTRLIDDLMEFSRSNRQALHSFPVDMTALTRSVIHDLTVLDPNPAVAIVVGELLPTSGDEALLRQVLANLIGNALKFARHADAPRLEISSVREGSEVIYRLRDNGAGFDMKHAGKLFNVFQRLHKQEDYEGTGVGLAIVHRIVMRHGGRVWAEGKVNQGATFYFALPAGADGAGTGIGQSFFMEENSL